MKKCTLGVSVLAVVAAAGALHIAARGPFTARGAARASSLHEGSLRGDTQPSTARRTTTSKASAFGETRTPPPSEVDDVGMDVEEVPPPKPEYTPEEKERMNYALQKIWPHYRRLAPIIFDEMLTEQEYDSEWTKQTTLGVARVLQQSALSGTALDSVDCYQTLCKVVVTSASEEDYQTFFMQGTLEGPLDAPSHGHRDVLKDGRIQTKAYVSRRTDGSPFVEMKDRMLAYVEREEQAQGDQGTPATDGDHG